MSLNLISRHWNRCFSALEELVSIPDPLQRLLNENARANTLTFLVTEGNHGSERLSDIPKVTQQVVAEEGPGLTCLYSKCPLSLPPKYKEEVSM